MVDLIFAITKHCSPLFTSFFDLVGIGLSKDLPSALVYCPVLLVDFSMSLLSPLTISSIVSTTSVIYLTLQFIFFDLNIHSLDGQLHSDSTLAPQVQNFQNPINFSHLTRKFLHALGITNKKLKINKIKMQLLQFPSLFRFPREQTLRQECGYR